MAKEANRIEMSMADRATEGKSLDQVGRVPPPAVVPSDQIPLLFEPSQQAPAPPPSAQE